MSTSVPSWGPSSGVFPQIKNVYPTFGSYHDVAYKVSSVTGTPRPLADFVYDRLMAFAHEEFFLVFEVNPKHGYKLKNGNYATATQIITWILTASKNFDEEGTTKVVVLSIKNFVIAFFIDTKSDSSSMEITLSKDANTAVCTRKKNNKPDGNDVFDFLLSKVRHVDFSILPEELKIVFNDIRAQIGSEPLSQETAVVPREPAAGGGSGAKKGRKPRAEVSRQNVASFLNDAPSGASLSNTSPVDKNSYRFSDDDLIRKIDEKKRMATELTAKMEAEKAKTRKMILSSDNNAEILTTLTSSLDINQLSILQKCISSRKESLQGGAST
jgi:hypothetical protein